MTDIATVMGIAFPVGFVAGYLFRDYLLQSKIYELKVQIRRLKDQYEDLSKSVMSCRDVKFVKLIEDTDRSEKKHGKLV